MSPQRVVVAGLGGAGKSTYAAQLAAALDLPFTELDGFVEGPGWTVLPDFVEQTEAFVQQPQWVTDSLLYPEVEHLLLDRADLVVWLDFELAVLLRRLVRRTLRRGLPPRPRLVNGNKEKLWAALASSSPLRAAPRDFAAHRAHLEQVLEGRPHVRLRTPQQAQAWLDSAARARRT